MRKIPWRRKWQPTPVFLPGESHGQKSLVGYSPWNCEESDMTEHACTHMSQQTFSVKVHIVNILSFVGHIWYQLHTDFFNPLKNIKTIYNSQSVHSLQSGLT